MGTAGVVVFIFVVVLCHPVAHGSGPLIHRGRPNSIHGILGLPKSTKQVSDVRDVKEVWFKQQVDHFNPVSTQTWNQRYFVNKGFHQEGAPVFLMFGGEGAASAEWLSKDTFMMVLAEKHNALAFELEHRYYGLSWPTPDMSTDNLAYLNSQQALADAATFRQAMVEKYNLGDNSKWVVFGGSYSGSLAAWFKLKYPHLAVGAVASSAPLHAIIDFKDYLRVVRDSLATTNPECDTQVGLAVDHLMYLASTPAFWPDITSLFRLCSYFNGYNQHDQANLFQTLAGNFEGVVQYNKDARLSGGTPNITIDTLCDIMTTLIDDTTALDRFVQVNSLMLKSTSQSCLDFNYDTFIDTLRRTDFNNPDAPGGRQWTYQTCVEFGYFQSSDYPRQPFGSLFPVKFFIKQCQDIFGDTFDEKLLAYAIERTNTMYGSIKPQLRNVTFPNGSIDPWHALGVVESLSDDVTAIYINGTAHCADMYPDTPQDPPALREARKKIAQQVEKWIERDARYATFE
ncbi:putative serine protease F56F10.1 [Ornithodoros turicata]|uniref:putative serine protease F56F10.1 n=1 Tax=Ornithodoros turicata TaxID=34597 RepID=UPI0031390441